MSRSQSECGSSSISRAVPWIVARSGIALGGHRIGDGQRHARVALDVLELLAEQGRRVEVDLPVVVEGNERVGDRPPVVADDGQLADERDLEQLLRPGRVAIPLGISVVLITCYRSIAHFIVEVEAGRP